MNYFVKDNCIHRFPIPKMCNAEREKEVLRDTVVHGVEECPYCFRTWPAEEEHTRH